MAFEIRSLYFYVVCFATLLMVIIGAVQIVYSVMDLLYPVSYSMTTVEEMDARLNAGRAPGDTLRLSRADLEKRVDAEQAREENRERRRAVRSLFGNIALLLIAAPVYLYHWRQVRHRDPAAR